MEAPVYAARFDRFVDGRWVTVHAEWVPFIAGKPADAIPHDGRDYVFAERVDDEAVRYVSRD